jgi:hypothetical protein
MIKIITMLGALSFFSTQVLALQIAPGELIEFSVVTPSEVQKDNKVLLKATLVKQPDLTFLPEYCLFTATAQEDASKLVLSYVRCVTDEKVVLNAVLNQKLYLKQGQLVPKCELVDGECKLMFLKEAVQFYTVFEELIELMPYSTKE